MVLVIIQHIGYLITLAGFLVRDILWLRLLLALAQMLLLSESLSNARYNSAFWQCTFIVINIGWSLKIMRERRSIELPAELLEIYQRSFTAFSRREFLYFWSMGRKEDVAGAPIIREGEHQKHLCLITAGEVEVVKAGREIARLGPGRFVAEMSFLTGEPASADVWALDLVSYVAWNQEKLHSLKLLNPPLFMKLQALLGADLSSKVRATSERVHAAHAGTSAPGA